MPSWFLNISSIEWKFGIHFFLSRAMFLGNFWLIYLVSKGYDLVDAAYLDIVFWSCLLIFEIPTGFIADKFGRKTSLFLSFVTQTVGIALFAIGSSLTIFLFSYAIWAIGITMQSGAEEAWLYDEIVHQFGDDHKYQRIYGSMIGIGLLSSAVAGYSSGLIAEVDLVYTIYANVVVFSIATLWILIIPHTIRIDQDSNPPRIRDAVLAIRNRRVISLSVLQICVGALILSVVFWFQVFLDENSVSYLYIAAVGSTGSVIMAITSRYNELFQKWIGHIAPYILPIIAGIAIIGMSVNLGLAVVGYMIIHLIRGIFNPILSKLINSELVTKIRATSLSIISALSTIIILSAELSTAHLIQKTNYTTSFFIIGVVLIIIVLILLIVRKRVDLSGFMHPEIAYNSVKM